MDFKAKELVQFYGSIAGTEGVSDKVKALCNDNIMAILMKLQPEVTKITSGLIT